MEHAHHTRPRLYLKTALKEGARVALPDDQWHYLTRVMRLKDGDIIRLFNEQDGEFAAGIAGKHAEIHSKIRDAAQPPFMRLLAFPLLPKDRLDFLIEKSVELGVTRLQPVITARSEIKTMNAERISRQIIEAVEQCERFTPPELAASIALPAWLAGLYVPCLAALERAQHIPALHGMDMARDLAFLVGPPGGFTDDERAAITACTYCQPVSLGSAVLRTDTAALALLANAAGVS